MNIKKNNVIIYQAKNGAIELHGDVQVETIWATQKQIAEVFDVTPQNITLHLKNIFKSGELEEKVTCKKSLQVQIEGNRKVKRTVKEYNLDAIISVGYRIDSVMGTNFRTWATKTLKQHITQGYTINKKILREKESQYLQAITDIKKIAAQGDLLDTDSILNLITGFSRTWFSLQSYDEQRTPQEGSTKKDITLDIDTLYADIAQLKSTLMQKDEATALFAQEKNPQALAGIIGNVLQSAFSRDVYETLEEKAAHLLYFVVKNHVFNDGNKRTGAFCFIWFLRQAGIDFGTAITPEALTSLTLLVAQSNPKEKDRVVGLILLMFQK